MSRTLIETPEAFHGQPSAAPDLRGLAARHVEPERAADRAVDWQRKATDLSELLGAALDEIDRLRTRVEKAEAGDKARMSRDCRTCVHETGKKGRDCGLTPRSPAFAETCAWINRIAADGLLDRNGAVIADTPTDCPGWASK
jgi:hypothetical protein